MYIIKALLHSIGRKKISMLLVWLQFSLIFIIAFALVNSYVRINQMEREKRQGIVADFDKCCKLVINTVSDSEKTHKDAGDFLMEVKKIDGVDVLGNYFSVGTSFSTLKENEAFVDAENKAVDEQKRYNEKLERKLPEKNYQTKKDNLSVEVLSADYGLFNSLIKNRILEGLKADAIIWNNELRPVILGYGYKDAFKIGDTFESKNGIFKCKVIGILDKGSRWLNMDGDGINFNMVNIDYTFVVLTDKPGPYFETNYRSAVLMNNYLISKETFDKNLKSKICQIAEKYGFSVGIYTLNEYFKSERENNMEQSYLRLFSILFLSSVAIFGMSSLIIYSIESSKREIGIRIACGAGMRHIIGIFCTEILLISIAAFFTACIIVNSKEIIAFLRIDMDNLSIGVYFLAALISILTCVLSCIFPVKRILKLTAKELTGGN